jgi:hypothetical protein
MCGGFHWSKVNEHRVKTIEQTLKTEKGRKNNPEKGRKNNQEKGGKNNCISDIFSLFKNSLPIPLPPSPSLSFSGKRNTRRRHQKKSWLQRGLNP